jgi:YD repeat-containing protein
MMSSVFRAMRGAGASLLVLLATISAPPVYSAQTVSYTYDAAGRLTRAEYDDSVRSVFTYDPNGNILSVVTEAMTAEAPDAPGASGALPTVFALGATVPNPARERLTMHFETPRTSSVRLEVHDSGGRRVRTVVHGVVPAGRYQVPWDGRNGSGQRVASGVYFVRFQADGFTASRTIRVLR